MMLEEMLAILLASLNPKLCPFTCNLSSSYMTLKEVLALIPQDHQNHLEPAKLHAGLVRWLAAYLPSNARVDKTYSNRLRDLTAKPCERPKVGSDQAIHGANHGT